MPLPAPRMGVGLRPPHRWPNGMEGARRRGVGRPPRPGVTPRRAFPSKPQAWVLRVSHRRTSASIGRAPVQSMADEASSGIEQATPANKRRLPGYRGRPKRKNRALDGLKPGRCGTSPATRVPRLGMHAFDRLSRVRPRQRRNCGKGHPFHSKFVSARPAAGSGPADLVRVTGSRQASSGAPAVECLRPEAVSARGSSWSGWPSQRCAKSRTGGGPRSRGFRLSCRDAVSLSALGGWERDPPVPIKTLAMWPRNLHARPRRPSSLCAASVGKNLFRAGRAGRETSLPPGTSSRDATGRVAIEAPPRLASVRTPRLYFNREQPGNGRPGTIADFACLLYNADVQRDTGRTPVAANQSQTTRGFQPRSQGACDVIFR